MPNHVTNFVRSPRLAELTPRLVDNDGNVDFNLVVPMPAGMSDITSGSTLSTFTELMGHSGPYTFGTTESRLERFKGFTPEDFEMCAKALRFFNETGFWSWYDWSIAKWGTKWNAYETEVNDHEISFLTAWSPPEGVFQALYDQTKIPFTVDWADEGGPEGQLSYP